MGAGAVGGTFGALLAKVKTNTVFLLPGDNIWKQSKETDYPFNPEKKNSL